MMELLTTFLTTLSATLSTTFSTALLLPLTFLLPLAGTLILAFSRGTLSYRLSALVGVGSVGLAALATVLLALGFCH